MKSAEVLKQCYKTLEALQDADLKQFSAFTATMVNGYARLHGLNPLHLITSIGARMLALAVGDEEADLDDLLEDMEDMLDE